jgi:hypothetical protein
MAFQLYTKQRAPLSEVDEVAISAAGIITISSSLSEGHLKDAKYVELYFDLTSKKIGIRAVAKESRASMQLLRPINSRRCAVSGRGFLRFYKIGMAADGKFKRASFPATFTDGMIVFSVK